MRTLAKALTMALGLTYGAKADDFQWGALTAEVKKKVRGVALPLLTFYNEDGTVNHPGMTKYVKQMIKDGCVEGQCVILAVASGGDFPSLSIQERKETAKTVIEAAEGKVPIFLSVQESHIKDTIDLAKYAEEIGYYGIQVSVPYYWTTSDGDAIQWFKTVHDATKKVILSFYNTPWENYDAPVNVLEEVAKLERVRVLKLYTDRQPQTFRWSQTITEFKDKFAIIDNTLQPVFNAMLGGTAFISHLASVFPSNQFEMFHKIEKGDYAGALAMQTAGLTPWYDFRVKAGAWTSGEGPPVKQALELCGRVNNTGPMRAPSRRLSPELLEELRQVLSKIGVPHVKPKAEVQIV